MAGNINLTIEKGKGIAYAIDKYLDTELNQDVKLNMSQWQSIFEIVKNDNATDKKQYTGGDTDITNGKHFIVQEGAYQITQSAMNQIMNIAKQALDKATQNDNTEPTGAEQVAVLEAGQDNVDPDAEVKQKLTEILKTADIDFASKSETYQVKLIAQYNNMAALAKQNNQEIDQNKITQYAKALEYREAQDEWAIAAEKGTTSSKTVNVSDFTEMAKGEILLADTTGDGKISKEEYIAYEASTDPGIEMNAEIKTMLESNFSKLDVDGNGLIDVTEQETLLRTTAGESSNDITADEWTSMQYNILTKDNLYNVKNDDETAKELQTILNGQIDFNNKSDTYKAVLIAEYRKMSALANSQKSEVNKDDIINYAKALEAVESENDSQSTISQGVTDQKLIEFTPSIDEFKELAKAEIALADTNGDGKLSKKELKEYEKKNNNIKKFNSQQRKEFRTTFKKLDKNSDGFIDVTEDATNFYTMATINDYKDQNGTVHRTMGDITTNEYVTAKVGLATSKKEAEQALASISLETTTAIGKWAKEHGHNPTTNELDQIPFKNQQEKINYLQWYSYEAYNRSDDYYQSFKARENQ